MGEQDALRGARVDVNQQANEGENKLAEFGRSLFSKGKALVDGVQKEAQNIDVNGLAAQAQKKLNNIDTGALAQQAGKIAGGVNGGDMTGIAGAAVGIAFPQLGIFSKASGEVGDVIARRQAKSLLGDPQKLADKMITSFDEFDREKTGFLDDGKLRRFDGITGITSDNRAVAQILRSGFTTINSLDGDASKKGISRQDIEVFSMMQNKDLLADHVNKRAFENGLMWGTVGAGAGGAAAYFSKAGLQFSMDAARSAGLGRIAIGAAAGAVALGGIAHLISKHSQNSFYEQKSKDVDRMMQAMKNSFQSYF